MRNKSKILFGTIILIAIAVAGYSYLNKADSTLDGKTDLTVQLQWFDGAQFAGLYVAKEKGFFLDEGLVVNLKPIAGYTSDPISILKNDNADIAIAPADRVLVRKNTDSEIKAIGTVFNRSLACYVIKKENFIDSLGIRNLENKTLAVFPKFDTENILLALKKKHNLNITNSQIIQASVNYLTDFPTTNDYSVIGSYLINEPIKLRKENVPIEIIDPKKYGINFYSDTYIVKTEDWSRSTDEKGINVKHFEKFIKAANKGWEYAKKNPDEAIDIMFGQITNKTKSLDGDFEKRSLNEILKYLGAGPKSRLSYMSEDVWHSMEEDLYSIGKLSQKGYVEELCDFDLINRIYNDKK